MHYVARWPTSLAASALRDEGATVGEIASRLGYTSEAAFSRAFKRVVGVPPAAVCRGELSHPIAP
jgi:AraC-like DNA-binding protein